MELEFFAIHECIVISAHFEFFTFFHEANQFSSFYKIEYRPSPISIKTFPSFWSNLSALPDFRRFQSKRDQFQVVANRCETTVLNFVNFCHKSVPRKHPGIFLCSLQFKCVLLPILIVRCKPNLYKTFSL